MLCAVEVLGGVLILRRIATADVTALQTEAQMHPCVAGFDVVFANVLIGSGKSDPIEMCTFNQRIFSSVER